MSDPERLIQGEDDLAQAMLRAAAGDGPSEASRQKVAAALGIRAAARAASWSAGSLIRWTGGTAIVLGLLGGAAYFVRGQNPVSAQRAASTNETVATPRAPSPAPRKSVEGGASVESAPPIHVPDPPVPIAPSKIARTAPPTAVTPKKKNASTLDAEMALLDGARVSLRAGRPDDALRTLDDYQAQFPHGLLVPEAAVVRIEALVKNGNKAGARGLGETFLRAHPDSPLADRVRSLTNL